MFAVLPRTKIGVPYEDGDAANCLDIPISDGSRDRWRINAPSFEKASFSRPAHWKVEGGQRACFEELDMRNLRHSPAITARMLGVAIESIFKARLNIVDFEGLLDFRANRICGEVVTETRKSSQCYSGYGFALYVSQFDTTGKFGVGSRFSSEVLLMTSRSGR